MAMENARAALARDARDPKPQGRVKSGRSVQGDDLDAGSLQFGSPCSGLVETTDDARSDAGDTSRDFDHQALGPARIEAEHDLHDSGDLGRGLSVRASHAGQRKDSGGSDSLGARRRVTTDQRWNNSAPNKL
jgi:hypothetical protein